MRKPIPENVRNAVLERDNYSCQYCGATHRKLHIDHVYPVSKGGGNEIENLVVACYKCNLRKHNRVGIWPMTRISVPVSNWIWTLFILGIGTAFLAKVTSYEVSITFVGCVIAAYAIGYETGWTSRDEL